MLLWSDDPREEVPAQGLETLASIPQLIRLRSLKLNPDQGWLGSEFNENWYSYPIGPFGARLLAASPHLANLTTLDLTANRIGPEGVAALAVLL